MLVMLPLQPTWLWLSGQPTITVPVGKDALRVPPATARDLQLLEDLVGRYAPEKRAFVATPYWPGAYAAFDRKSPTWEIYALFPRSEAFQRAEIRRIEAADPGFVLIVDAPLDGVDDRRFRHTHPLVDAYVRDHFVPARDPMADPAYRLYVRQR
jgi:hypothetical protein